MHQSLNHKFNSTRIWRSAHPGLACQAIAEDWYVGNSEKSQYHECVYEPATARSFRSVRYYYCANANKFMQDAPTPQPYIPVEDAEVPESQHGAIGRRG